MREDRESVIKAQQRSRHIFLIDVVYVNSQTHARVLIWTRCPLTAEFLVLCRKHKGLGYDVEVFKAVGLLHPLDVFVEPVFPCELVRPGKRRER